MAPSIDDTAPEEIRYLLARAGFTFADVDRMHGLHPGTARNSARKPYANGEQAIARTLGIPARLLWPSRYETSGKRLKPQPRQNYTCPPRVGHGEKRRVS